MEKINNRVLILGSTGMLGHMVYYYLKENSGYEIVDIVFRNKLHEGSIICDLSDKEKTERLIEYIAPAYIINCVGVLINRSNNNPANAIYINSYLPHQLEQIADRINATLIHISTDCVFSGKKGGYIESDEKDGKDTYAKSKGLGEVISDNHLTLRTSIIGPELKKNGEGLFHWFMLQSGDINCFVKAIWSGVTTLELSKVIKQALIQDVKGLYHVTNGTPINKFVLCNLFKEVMVKDNIIIHPIDGKCVNKSFIDTRKDIKYNIVSYEDMMMEQKIFMINHVNLYKHYLNGKEEPTYSI